MEDGGDRRGSSGVMRQVEVRTGLQYFFFCCFSQAPDSLMRCGHISEEEGYPGDPWCEMTE